MAIRKHLIIASLSLCLAPAAFAEQTQPVAVATASIDVAAKEATVRKSDAMVLDVRTPGEFEAGHIEGAVNININDGAFAQRIAQLDRSKTYLVHCAVNAPNGRADRAIQQMQALGFARLENLEGGYKAWVDAGGEVTQ